MSVGECAELEAANRTMLGERQEAWLFAQLDASRARWNLMAQGTLMAHVDEDTGPGRRYWTDSWNGYPAARTRLMNFLAERKIANPVVLSGDIHAFIVSGLHRQAADLESPAVASEFVGTSLSSQGIPQKMLDVWRSANPNLLFATGEYRGYLRLDATRERLQADLIAMETVKTPRAGRRTLRSFVVEDGRPGPVSLT